MIVGVYIFVTVCCVVALMFGSCRRYNGEYKLHFQDEVIRHFVETPAFHCLSFEAVRLCEAVTSLTSNIIRRLCDAIERLIGADTAVRIQLSNVAHPQVFPLFTFLFTGDMVWWGILQFYPFLNPFLG